MYNRYIAEGLAIVENWFDAGVRSGSAGDNGRKEFTDLESAAKTLASLGYEATWQRGSVLSWILITAKSTDELPAK